MGKCRSPVTVFAKTGTGYSTNSNSPTPDPSARVFSLEDSSNFGIAIAYTKGTSGESSINFGVDVSINNGSTWYPWIDTVGARRSYTLGASATGVFALTPAGEFLAGDLARIVVWTTGASVATTVFTVDVIPILE